MTAALATAAPAARYGVRQRLVLKRTGLAVTVRQQPDAQEPRYAVTLDEGQLAGLPLWATETELTPRPT